MDDIVQTASKEEFLKIVCDIIKRQAEKNISLKGAFTFVLSGGRTPKEIFDELALNYKDSITWSRVHFFWLDERSVEPNNEDSNYKLAYDHLISKIDKIGSVHRIKGELEPAQAAKEYGKELLSFFGTNKVKFDFVLLGMGEDGHMASLFPNSNEIKKVNDLVLFTDKPYNGYRRITLGLNLINTIAFKLLLVKGDKKLSILENINGVLPINKIKNKNIVYLG